MTAFEVAQKPSESPVHPFSFLKNVSICHIIIFRAKVLTTISVSGTSPYFVLIMLVELVRMMNNIIRLSSITLSKTCTLRSAQGPGP